MTGPTRKAHALKACQTLHLLLAQKKLPRAARPAKMKACSAVLVAAALMAGLASSAEAFLHMPPFPGSRHPGLHRRHQPVFPAMGDLFRPMHRPDSHPLGQEARKAPAASSAAAALPPRPAELEEPISFTLQVPQWAAQQSLKYEWQGVQDGTSLVKLYSGASRTFHAAMPW